MFGLTPLGIAHTAISLAAVVAGAVLLARDKEIAPTHALGRFYLWTTVATCVTGFGIFQHGGFGNPHVLGIITLVVLGVAVLAMRTTIFGRLSRYVSTIGFSATFLFHMIPGFTETFTRLPPSAPLFSGPQDPVLQKIFGVCFLLFFIGAFLQIRRLRAQPVALQAVAAV